MEVIQPTNYKGQDPQGWLVSEKLDGVRAVWDGEIFKSRNGAPLNVPEWFCDGLSGRYLDGELWLGRGQFERVLSMLKTKEPKYSEWSKARYMVFDAPLMLGGFKQRAENLKEEIASAKCAYAVDQLTCQSRNHLDTVANALVLNGAEGVMLRHPESYYIGGKTSELLRHKPFYDSEAQVIGYTEGKGKRAGKIGALRCQWQGVEFGLGCNKAMQARIPSIGSMVTFKYYGLTVHSMPRQPVFLAVRDYE